MDEQEMKTIEKLLEKQTDQFQRYQGIVEENFQHKLDIVVEGHQLLGEKIDRLDGRMDGLDGRMYRLEGRMGHLEGKMDRLEVKVDAAAADLSAHRKDTEAHGPVYRVKEE
jgi:predicted nuclease with TOPRIM domain